MIMRNVFALVVMLLFISCKKNKNNIEYNDENVISPNENIDTVSIDTDIETIDKSLSIELKQRQLIERIDDSKELEELILDKKYFKKEEDYTINFNYPLLNESFKPTHSNFNEFVKDYYINITKTEAEILESKLLCDSIEAKNFREERFVDYKVYNVNDQLVSVLFYKENFYSGAMHPTYTFDCFNFDLNKGVFMAYEDFFNQGTEEELVKIINERINKYMSVGNMFYDCWNVSLDDFLETKNNFVINDFVIEFYFDDCVICPSYTGTYSIELPIADLQLVLKKHQLFPFDQ